MIIALNVPNLCINRESYLVNCFIFITVIQTVSLRQTTNSDEGSTKSTVVSSAQNVNLDTVHKVFYLQVEVKMRSSLSFESFPVRAEHCSRNFC